MFRLKIFAVICAVLMLASCTSAKNGSARPIDGTADIKISPLASDETDVDADGYILAASNEKFSLYYEEKGLTVKVKNNITGAVMCSAATPDEGSSETWRNFVNSGIVLEYFKGEAVNINKTNMYSGKPSVKISRIENGFAAELNFKNIGMELTLFVNLNDNGIRVQVPSSTIKETNEQFKLAAIYVMPFLGYTRLGEVDGYMLIPDGNGAVIELRDNNEKFSQPYKARIYGGNFSVETDTAAVQKFDDEIATTSDSAGVFAPVFGMVHTSAQNGFIGIIESGKYNAEIYAYPNGVITEFNWITARYVYREVYQYLTGQSGSITSSQKERETFDINAVYRFVGGDDADYVGLAHEYREYLTENGMLKASADDYSLRLDFFAGDVEKGLFSKKFVSMTTVKEMDSILSSLIERGIDRLEVSLKGWQKGGIYGELNTRLKFEGEIGSIKEYAALAEKYKDKASFMLYGDFLNVYKNSASKKYIYQYNGKVFSDETFMELHPTLYRYTADNVKNNLEKFTASLSNKGDIGIAFDGVTGEVYSYSAGEKMDMFSRQYAAQKHIDAVKTASKGINTAYISPNDYMWSDMQKYYDFRVYGSDYKFVSREVPFFAIALRGSVPIYGEYVNFKADTVEYRLKLIENGIYPSFLLTHSSPSELIYTDSASLFSCEYGEYSDMIAEYDKIFSELAKRIKNSAIADHEILGDISVTTYENGVRVVVNYGKDSAMYGSHELDGSSYLILEKGEL